MRHNLALVAAVLALAVCVSGQVPQASKPFLDTQIAMNVRAPATGLPSAVTRSRCVACWCSPAWCSGCFAPHMLGELALCIPQSPGLPAYVIMGRTRRSGRQCAPCAAPYVRACYKQGAGLANILDLTLTRAQLRARRRRPPTA
jgi:hypothetical protein